MQLEQNKRSKLVSKLIPRIYKMEKMVKIREISKSCQVSNFFFDETVYPTSILADPFFLIIWTQHLLNKYADIEILVCGELLEYIKI